MQFLQMAEIEWQEQSKQTVQSCSLHYKPNMPIWQSLPLRQTVQIDKNRMAYQEGKGKIGLLIRL